jgi:hypothetical protein
MPSAGRVAGRVERAGFGHARLEPLERGDRCRGAVEGPAPTAERDHRRANHEREERRREPMPMRRRCGVGNAPRDERVRAEHEHEAQCERTFPQARRVRCKL